MYVILFILEFFLLFFMAKSLINSLSNLIFRLTKSKHVTVIILSYLFLPGTIVHELAHLFIAGLLLVRTGSMDLAPKIMDNEIKFGSVDIERTDFLRRAIIGVAPVLVGMIIIFGTLFYLQSPGSKTLIIYLVSFYVIFEVGNTLFSSRKDLEGTIELLVAIIFISIALFIVKVDIARAFFDFLQKKEIISFFKTADLFLIPLFIIDLTIIVLMNLLSGKLNGSRG